VTTFTLNDLAYDLYELMRANIRDNEVEDIRQIKFWLTNQREFWVSNELDKRAFTLNTTSPFIQTLDNLQMENVDLAEKLGVDVGQKIKRTVDILPNVIAYHNGIAIEGVYPLCLLGKKVYFTTWDEFLAGGNMRFNQKTIYAAMSEGHIYLKQVANLDNYKLIDKIKVNAIFENPEDLSLFTNSNGDVAYSEDTKYPISRKFYENIKREIIKTNFELVLSGKDSRTEAAAV